MALGDARNVYSQKAVGNRENKKKKAVAGRYKSNHGIDKRGASLKG